MTARKVYRGLDRAEKVRFLDVCTQPDAPSPRDMCPLCGHPLRSKEDRPRYCEVHHDWEPHSVVVSCHRCKVTYAVLDPDRCRAEASDAWPEGPTDA